RVQAPVLRGERRGRHLHDPERASGRVHDRGLAGEARRAGAEGDGRREGNEDRGLQLRGRLRGEPLDGGSCTLARDFFTLIKPEVTSLVVAATFIGFWAGSPGPIDGLLLAIVLLGTTLVAGGTAALNMVI